MAINKGYLTAKTNKLSDEYYTPREAVLPILQYIDKGNKNYIPHCYNTSYPMHICGEKYYKLDNGKYFYCLEMTFNARRRCDKL